VVQQYSYSWHCELCGKATPPVIGNLFAGARHRCRTCAKTVCSKCSFIPQNGVRTCRVCELEADTTKHQSTKREKYVFLVRHAQSTWNQNVDLVKTVSSWSLEDISLKDVVSRAAHLMAHEMWHRDHPISNEGVRQTQELRHKIVAVRQCSPSCCAGGSVSSSSSPTCPRCSEPERVQRYYDAFLEQREQIYCSPLLRALQTAHLSLPEEDGWGSIKLLKDARECYSRVFERDCLGTGVGTHIVDRAMQMGHELPGLQHRVDSTDCAQMWWSEEPETEAEVEVRLQSLWRRLLDEDGDSSCVLVTHSNLIKALLMRFGGLDEDEEPGNCDCDQRDGFFNDGLLDVEDTPSALARLSDLDGPDMEPYAAWQVVGSGPKALQRMKVERLQNCGVLGLRCVLEAPTPNLYPEVDGWVDIDSHVNYCSHFSHPQWVAKDALLMFDSILVK